MAEEATRLALCAVDAVTGEVRPVRIRNGRLLLKIMSDPAVADIKAAAHRSRVSDTKILLGADSDKREKMDALQVGEDGILEVEIAGGLAGVTGFANHHARHENGGADEISVQGLSGLLADSQTPLAHAVAGVLHTGVVTTIADPGVDTQIPTEKAVRDALDVNVAQENHNDGGLLWAFFMGAA